MKFLEIRGYHVSPLSDSTINCEWVLDVFSTALSLVSPVNATLPRSGLRMATSKREKCNESSRLLLEIEYNPAKMQRVAVRSPNPYVRAR